MALADPQQNFVSTVGKVCKQLLALQSDMLVINELYNGSPDWDTLFNDNDISEIPSFEAVGLNTQVLADAVFQVATIRNQIVTGNLPAVVLLAQLA